MPRLPTKSPKSSAHQKRDPNKPRESSAERARRMAAIAKEAKEELRGTPRQIQIGRRGVLSRLHVMLCHDSVLGGHSPATFPYRDDESETIRVWCKHSNRFYDVTVQVHTKTVAGSTEEKY